MRPDLLARADRLAGEVEQTRDWVIEQALERYLDEEEGEIGRLRQALAESEAGEVLDAEDVHRWMDSWDTDKELPCPARRAR